MSVVMGVNGVNKTIGAVYLGAAGANEGWSFSGAKLNLFVQPDEPTVKDGLWIQAPEKHPVKRVVTRDASFAVRGEWDNIRLSEPTGRAEFSKSYFAYGQKVFLMYADNNNSNRTYAAVFNNDTNTFTILNTNVRCNANMLMYKFDLSTHVLYIRGTYYVTSDQYNYAEFTFNFDTNVFTVGATSQAGSTNPYAVPSTYYDTSIAGTDPDGNTYWCHESYHVSSTPYQVQFAVRRANYNTNTFSYVASHTTSETLKPHGEAPMGALFDRNVYFYLCAGKYYTVDIDSGAVTDISSGGEALADYRSLACATSGQVFFCSESTANTLQIYNIATGTWSRTPAADMAVNGRLLFGLSDRVLVFSGGLGGSSNTYHIISEILANNTLALVNGRSYKCNVITTSQINALRYTLANAWWYDTDFHEYPTYIGNGTAFTKIKN